jgi:hypothetical protein
VDPIIGEIIILFTGSDQYDPAEQQYNQGCKSFHNFF